MTQGASLMRWVYDLLLRFDLQKAIALWITLRCKLINEYSSSSLR